jgi:hypothetical protein
MPTPTTNSKPLNEPRQGMPRVVSVRSVLKSRADAPPSRLRWGLLALLLAAPLAWGQQLEQPLRHSMAGEAAAQARRLQQGDAPYTIKSGDLKVLASSSMGMEWNDNVNTSKTNAMAAWVLKPHGGLLASYPVTDRNLLTLNVGFGYDKYLEHERYSSWALDSDSQASFDFYIKDIWINVHDRFSYSQDSSQEASVANTGDFGTFNNTAGLSATWDLDDVTLNLGYDHQNTFSTASSFNQVDQQSEILSAQAAMHINPALLAGVEGTASYVRHDQQELNDYDSYSAGLFADWQPGTAFHIHPRAGYTFELFSQNSTNMVPVNGSTQRLPADNQDSWYADLTLSHQPTDWVSYSLSAGHELRSGVQTDAIDDWYVRPSATWSIIRDWSLNTYFSYEHGEQSSSGNLLGTSKENYDWLSGGASVNYAITKRLSSSLYYRVTTRYSNQTDNEYTQNIIGLMMTYTFE